MQEALGHSYQLQGPYSAVELLHHTPVPPPLPSIDPNQQPPSSTMPRRFGHSFLKAAALRAVLLQAGDLLQDQSQRRMRRAWGADSSFPSPRPIALRSASCRHRFQQLGWGGGRGEDVYKPWYCFLEKGREPGVCEGRRDASERRQAQSSEPTTQSFSFNTVNNTLEQGRATWVPSVLPKASPALWPHPIPVHGDNGATNTFLAAIPLAGAGSMLSHCPSQQLQHHHPKKGKIRIQKGSGLCFGAAPPPPPAAP